jgi:hypothetical protein
VIRALYGLFMMVMFCLASAPAPCRQLEVVQSGVTIRYAWDDSAGRKVVELCQQALADRGEELLAAVVPAGRGLQPIDCLLMRTAEFADRFGATLPDWGIGVALGSGRVIAIDYERQPGIGRSIQEVFLHELAHAAVFQVSEGVWLPAWFHEGVAMLLSGEWRVFDTVNLVLSGSIPALDRLEGPFPAQANWADQAYRTSLLAVDTVRRWYGDDAIGRIIASSAQAGDFERGFAAVTGETVGSFTGKFGRSVHHRFGWLFMLTRWPTLFVLMALLFTVGAIARLIRNRRRLAEMPE